MNKLIFTLVLIQFLQLGKTQDTLEDSGNKTKPSETMTSWESSDDYQQKLPTNISCKDGTDHFCASCKGDKCAVCFSSENIQGVCKPVDTQLEFCSQYDSQANCIYCKYGYFLQAGKCVKTTLKNCFTHHISEPSKCGVCDGYVLRSDGQCDSEVRCTQKNCRSCVIEGGKEICLWCQDNYILSQAESFECIKAEGFFRNCFSLDADGNCATCKFGYYINPTLKDVSKCVKSTAYEWEMIFSVFTSILLLTIGLI
jgi:hypothetical protein